MSRTFFCVNLYARVNDKKYNMSKNLNLTLNLPFNFYASRNDIISDVRRGSITASKIVLMRSMFVIYFYERVNRVTD